MIHHSVGCNWSLPAYCLLSPDVWILSCNHLSNLNKTVNKGWKDYFEDYKVSFNHNKKDLVIRIESTLNEAAANEAFGFTDLKVVYCNEPTGDCTDNTEYVNNLGPFVSSDD